MCARALGTWSGFIGSKRQDRVGPIAVFGPAGFSLAVGVAPVDAIDADGLTDPLGVIDAVGAFADEPLLVQLVSAKATVKPRAPTMRVRATTAV